MTLGVGTATAGPPQTSSSEFDWLPSTLLWEVPLASQRGPRGFGKVTHANDETTYETAIGATFGLFRLPASGAGGDGFQVDIFAVVFARFNKGRALAASDFRVGMPFTYRRGPWQLKLAYEHESSHLGDQLIQDTGREPIRHVRDEVVLAVSRRWLTRVRAYAQVGFAFHTNDVIGNDRDRYQVGVEWIEPEPWALFGSPYAAVDVLFRRDQDFEPNVTLQAGWRWRHDARPRALRFGFEVYRGRSPYGQFFLDDESWLALTAIIDW